MWSTEDRRSISSIPGEDDGSEPLKSPSGREKGPAVTDRANRGRADSDTGLCDAVDFVNDTDRRAGDDWASAALDTCPNEPLVRGSG